MKPLWKQLFDTVEQATGPALANLTASNQFAELMKVSLKIGNDMAKQSEALSRQWLHAWNLPAAGDVAYLKTQIGSLEAEVRSLRRTIEVSALPAKAAARSTTPTATRSATRAKKAPAPRAGAPRAGSADLTVAS